MMIQRYKFYPAIFLLVLTIIANAGCRSARSAQVDSIPAVRTTIEQFIQAMNERDIKTLETLYADDFMSYEPIYKVPKKELLESIQKGFDQQNYSIKAKVIEIISGPKIATAQLRWVIIKENQEVTFDNNLVQIWKKKEEGWKLTRILFYSPSELPTIDDFDF